MAEENELELSELSFDELNINENLLRGIYAYGFEKPSIIQHKSIPVLSSGKDVSHKHNLVQVKQVLFQLDH